MAKRRKSYRGTPEYLDTYKAQVVHTYRAQLDVEGVRRSLKQARRSIAAGNCDRALNRLRYADFFNGRYHAETMNLPSRSKAGRGLAAERALTGAWKKFAAKCVAKKG